MPRPLRDRRRLTDRFIRSLIPDPNRPTLYYDADQRGLVLIVHPSARKSFSAYYRCGGRARWLRIGDASIGVDEARGHVVRVLCQVAEGRDPAAERRADRRADTFAALHASYVELHARRRNRSWRQADALIRAHVLPHLGRMRASAIARGDVRLVLARVDDRPGIHNRTLAAISAVFSWAIREEVAGVRENPCRLIRRHEMRSRERVLGDREVALLWPSLDSTLRLILLTGARPGEVVALRVEDVRDGVWSMPGEPTGLWPGTKNKSNHRVPLSEPAAAIVVEHVARRPRRRASEELLKRLWARCGIPKVTPHDLRRSFATLVARLGYGRQAVNRLLNHADYSVGSVYDRYGYEAEDRRIVDAVGRHIAAVVEGRAADNVVRLR